jgi:hypothetical protein
VLEGRLEENLQKTDVRALTYFGTPRYKQYTHSKRVEVKGPRGTGRQPKRPRGHPSRKKVSQMSRKIIMACMAVVALAAFALPASASASKATLEEAGVPLDPTTKECTGVKGTICIRATNTDTVSTLTNASKEPLAECTNVSMTGYLLKNTHAAIEGTIAAASFNGTPGVTPHTTHCKSSFGTITVTTNPATNGLQWCLRSTETMAADEVQIRGGSCTAAARPIRFILDSSVAGECTYERSAAVVGEVTTTPNPALIHIKEQEFPRIAGGFLCPSKGFLDLTMSLYTDTEKEEPLTVLPVA